MTREHKYEACAQLMLKSMRAIEDLSMGMRSVMFHGGRFEAIYNVAKTANEQYSFIMAGPEDEEK